MSNSLKSPYVETILKYCDLAILLKIMTNLDYSNRKTNKFELAESDTIHYLKKTIQDHKNLSDRDLVKIQLHMADDVGFLIIAAKSKLLFKNFTSAEYRNYELWNLEELIFSLPEKYNNS